MTTSFSLHKSDFFFQHLRDKLSVSSKHERCLLSSYTLQSSFLAEVNDHDEEEAWGGKNLPYRLDAILKRIEEQEIPHPIFSGQLLQKNYASSLEARRVAAFIKEKRVSFYVWLGLLAGFISAVLLYALGIFLPVDDPENYTSFCSDCLGIFFISLLASLSLVFAPLLLLCGMKQLRGGTGRCYPVCMTLFLLTWPLVVLETADCCVEYVRHSSRTPEGTTNTTEIPCALNF